MVEMTKRNQQKQELISSGFSAQYVDEWPPKTRLYRHTPSYNVAGEITDEVGTSMGNVPGSPDYVLAKRKIGLFPWPPSNECECRWCTERASEELSSDTCSQCDFQAKGETPQAIASSLRMHVQHRHKEE